MSDTCAHVLTDAAHRATQAGDLTAARRFALHATDHRWLLCTDEHCPIAAEAKAWQPGRVA